MPESFGLDTDSKPCRYATLRICNFALAFVFGNAGAACAKYLPSSFNLAGIFVCPHFIEQENGEILLGGFCAKIWMVNIYVNEK